MRWKYFHSELRLLAAIIALSYPISSPANETHAAALSRLLNARADIREALEHASPLHFAAMQGDAARISQFVSSGADINAPNALLGTPLHAAIRYGTADAVNRLLGAGADPNARDQDDLTPLIVSAADGKLDVVKSLILFGADVNAVSVSHRSLHLGRGNLSVLHVARKLGFASIAEELIAAGAHSNTVAGPGALANRADPDRGRDLAKVRCGRCHLVESNGPPVLFPVSGPPLMGIFGRKIASQEKYDYSEALRSFGGTWTRDRIFAFSLSPMLVVPGTHMGELANATPEEINDIVAHFQVYDFDESRGELPACPARGSEFAIETDCFCSPPFGKGAHILLGKPARSSIEGSGPYSWYSDTCLAGIHAGAIGREGGPVRVSPQPPQPIFVGSLANGVYSGDFGRSERNSFGVMAIE